MFCFNHLVINHGKFWTQRWPSMWDVSPAAFGLPQWLCWICLSQMHARWRQYWLGPFHKSPVPQSSISCWAYRHDQHGLFYLGHWIGAILSMWSMRPELVPMWMGLLSRLTERLRRGQPVASHSVSALHRCPRHPDSWSIDSYELCKRDHWNCNCRWWV